MVREPIEVGRNDFLELDFGVECSCYCSRKGRAGEGNKKLCQEEWTFFKDTNQIAESLFNCIEEVNWLVGWWWWKGEGGKKGIMTSSHIFCKLA